MSPQQEIEKQEAIAAFDVQCQEKGGWKLGDKQGGIN